MSDRSETGPEPGWEEEVTRYLTQREAFAQLQETVWVPLAQAEAEAEVSRSALRSWFRDGDIPSRLVEGPHGPQRIVPLGAVIERAARSPRIQRRHQHNEKLQDEVALLRQRLDRLESRLAELETLRP
jgi:transposase